MHRKSTKKLGFKATKVGKDFTAEKLTMYSGLTVINDNVNHLGLIDSLERAFPTVKNNATKISNAQIFYAAILSSLCGVNLT